MFIEIYSFIESAELPQTLQMSVLTIFGSENTRRLWTTKFTTWNRFYSLSNVHVKMKQEDLHRKSLAIWTINLETSSYMLSLNPVHDAFEIAQIFIPLFVFLSLIFILDHYFLYYKLQKLFQKWLHCFYFLFIQICDPKIFVSCHLLSTYCISDMCWRLTHRISPNSRMSSWEFWDDNVDWLLHHLIFS